MPTSNTLKPSIAAFIAAAFWGLYWLPLRHIEAAGIVGGWSVFAIYFVPFLFLLPLMLVRHQKLSGNFPALLLIGLTAGFALASYATSFLHTTVMRTTLLFYMTPIWSTLLSIVFLNEQAGFRRWISMAIGFFGLWIMLSKADGTQASLNIGDLAALAAGISWGISMVLIRKAPQLEALDIVPLQYLSAIAASAVFLMLGATSSNPASSYGIPAATAWLQALPWLFGFYVLIVLPSLYVCARCAQLLSPGRVGILMMSEVLVAGVSAPLVAGELLSLREVIAAMFILFAVVLEITTPEPGTSTISSRK
ncbi:hypothetical protein AB833_18595 [Chromatiales bacterium (ex Bugula neritina AB1)]|nr:hypothetical protein AB833_18595 [Chromatiales bacterium (ex Bugula neritina AB1)]